jgi:CRISPR system Cascade subunit CasB
MPAEDQPRRYWAQYVGADNGWRFNPAAGSRISPPGEDLAVLRAGLGREAGTVPAMCRFYTSAVDDRLARRDQVTAEQEAEHAALALFGMHQQSRPTPMHRSGVKLGEALRNLRATGKFSEEALDARVNAAATATHLRAVLIHLRGLVSQLRTMNEPLDYDLLLTDLQDFQTPDGRARVRRRWGMAYYGWKPAPAVPPQSRPADVPAP